MCAQHALLSRQAAHSLLNRLQLLPAASELCYAKFVYKDGKVTMLDQFTEHCQSRGLAESSRYRWGGGRSRPGVNLFARLQCMLTAEAPGAGCMLGPSSKPRG